MPFDTIGAFSVIFLYSILPSDKSGMHHNFALVMEAGFRPCINAAPEKFQLSSPSAASDKPFSDQPFPFHDLRCCICIHICINDRHAGLTAILCRIFPYSIVSVFKW